ncbi:hypothetical protein PIB30_067493 [Stylosanthes scabra]|uniref:Uncharacterized protein n=1 Tax=Stylosanthes scabra TaxID=79078 RepID=A0ABU6QNQ0_9FABA|nr:hypothetical protein [Stylosanthes scabra]
MVAWELGNFLVSSSGFRGSTVASELARVSSLYAPFSRSPFIQNGPFQLQLSFPSWAAEVLVFAFLGFSSLPVTLSSCPSSISPFPVFRGWFDVLGRTFSLPAPEEDWCRVCWSYLATELLGSGGLFVAGLPVKWSKRVGWRHDVVTILLFRVSKAPSSLFPRWGLYLQGIPTLKLAWAARVVLKTEKTLAFEDQVSTGERRVPKMSSTSLRSFFKNRVVANEMSLADLEKVATSEPTGAANVSLKKRKMETASLVKDKSIVESQVAAKSTEDVMGSKDVSLSEVVLAMESQRVLHGYSGDQNVSSLWCEHYPFMSVIDKYFQSPVDVKMINEIEDVAINRFMQVVGARMMCIGREREVGLLADGDIRKQMDNLLTMVKEKDKKIASLSDALNLKVEEVGDLKKQVGVLKPQAKELCEVKEEVMHVKRALKETEENRFKMFAQGFNRVVSQVRVLAPDFDVNVMHVAKIVLNGKLVDDDVVEEEEGESEAVVDK